MLYTNKQTNKQTIGGRNITPTDLRRR